MSRWIDRQKEKQKENKKKKVKSKEKKKKKRKGKKRKRKRKKRKRKKKENKRGRKEKNNKNKKKLKNKNGFGLVQQLKTSLIKVKQDPFWTSFTEKQIDKVILRIAYSNKISSVGVWKTGFKSRFKDCLYKCRDIDKSN